MIFFYLAPTQMNFKTQQIDWIIKSRDEFEKKMDNGNTFNYTNKIGSKVANFDFGFAAGIEYKLKHDKGMGFGIRYYQGITDVMKDKSNTRNSAWIINIGIPIGTGKPAATNAGEP